MKLKGVEVRINCNDEPADEYVSEDTEQPEDTRLEEAVRYIEVQSGARFDVLCSIDSTFAWGGADSINVYRWVDGKYMTGTSFYRKHFSDSRILRANTGLWILKDGREQYMNFAFDDLEIRGSQFGLARSH
jgi:hypothetical protein